MDKLIIITAFVFFQVSAQLQPSSFSVSEFSGEWDERAAAHLLRRTLLGPTYGQIQDAVDNGLTDTVDTLFEGATDFSSTPLAYDSSEGVALFLQSWVTTVYPVSDQGTTHNARRRSLRGWLAQEFMNTNHSLADKMLLFWINHFGCSESVDARITYDYFLTLRQYALGNVKDLVSAITIHPHMLEFLNGEDNIGSAPNDNYSRECKELFTIGKGDQIGEGDYSTYTEQDVSAGAKIFSGWTIDGKRSSTIARPTAVFVPDRHNTEDKELSYHFDNVVVQNADEQEYQNYIDIIFARPGIGLFLSREIYRFFVGEVTDNVETYVIPEMNQVFIDSGFEIEPVLRLLFSSEHFYDSALRGSLIKSPIDFVYSIYNSTHSSLDFSQVEVNYAIGRTIFESMSNMDMDLMNVPAVAGWEAYYLEPNYSRLWMNSVYLQSRVDFVEDYVDGNRLSNSGNIFHPSVIDTVAEFSDPANATELINDWCLVLFPREVSESDKIFLKSILTDDLPDFEWAIEYETYLADTTDMNQEFLIEERLRKVLSAASVLLNFYTF